MFGIEKRVERVRQALIHALRARGFEIMTKYDGKKPEEIPKHDLTRAQVLFDIAEILVNLRIDKHPEDEA
jgi:hypothetical protein